LIAHRTARIVVFAALVVALAIVPAAFAGKGGGGGKPGGGGGGGSTGGSGTINGPIMVNDQNGDGAANWGDTITFSVSTTTTDRPYVNLDCTQNGTLVYSGQVGYYASYAWVQQFTLSSSYWTGGAASCTARLTYWNGKSWATITSISVPVAA
jgi:hypothetical protein